ncbi:hypothetical protein [Embleya sp. NPDC059237]|uniref:hypothetical protein n=1 Tax=Embleya sp. NPDC059237 TaxID=3346784 RepID=UPI00369B5F24
MVITGEWRRKGAVIACICTVLVLAGCGSKDSKPKFEMHSWEKLTQTQRTEASTWMDKLRDEARAAHTRIVGDTATGDISADIDKCWNAWPKHAYKGPADLENPVRSSWSTLCQTALAYTRG